MQINKKSQNLARLTAIAALLQCGGFVNETRAEDVPVQPAGALTTKLTQDETQDFAALLRDYAEKSPAARKLIGEFAGLGEGAKLSDPDVAKYCLELARRKGHISHEVLEDKQVPFAERVFHEIEHKLQLKQAADNNINAASFATVDDLYTYLTLIEALAERKATLCREEYARGGEGFQQARTLANIAFNKRLLVHESPIPRYTKNEEAAVFLTNTEPPVFANQTYFGPNPNWDEIVSVLSRGEVTKMPVEPRVSLNFLSVCLWRGLEKNPNATSIKDFDVSCALSHLSELQKDEKTIKTVISDALVEVYNSCVKTGKPVSPKMRQMFSYLAGVANAEQEKAIAAGKMARIDAFNENLKEFSVPELFDLAINLVESPEVQAYQTNATKKLGKILRFEKQILVPPMKINTRTLDANSR